MEMAVSLSTLNFGDNPILIDMEQNNIKDYIPYNIEFIKLMIQKLKIENLYLSSTNIGKSCYRYFNELLNNSINKNWNLKTLDISNNNIDDNGIIYLSHGLTKSTSIISLNLSNNFFGFNGFLSFSDSLKKNKSLKTLILSNNIIDPNVIENFSNSLQINNTLTYLDLSNCGLTIKGLYELFRCICKNNSLQILNLAWNNFQIETFLNEKIDYFQKFLDFLLEAISLTEIDLSGIFFGEKERQSIENIWIQTDNFRNRYVIQHFPIFILKEE